MKKINIIMFSMSHYTDWQKGRVNRNYHILNQLQKDERIDKIVSVDFLPFNWKKVAKIYWENIIWGMKDLEMIYGDLTSACHRVNNKLYIYSTIDSIYSQKTVVKEMCRIIKALNLDNIVFWSYNPLFTALLEEVGCKIFGEEKFVFDAVDNWLEHPAFQAERYQGDLKVGYQMIRQDADLIFTVSQHLKDTLFPDSRKCYWVPNGVDVEHFVVPETNFQTPAELQEIKKPIIGYHGIIEGRVDLDLVKYIAERNPDKSIVLLGGGVWRSYQKVLGRTLASQKNIHLLPFIPYQKLPQYIHAFDVAMVPHKLNGFTKSMNPLKLYEYSAAGKPVVSTEVAGAETFHNILYIGKTPEEFNQKIQLALREDSEELRKTRVEVIADDSWYGRMQLMTKYLFELLD